MSFQSLRRVLRSARKGLCSTCSKARYPQLEAAGAGHVGCLIYTFETLGQLVKDDHNVTAIHVAARKGQISILIYLIENNLVEGVHRARNGATPIHDAAGTGHLDCLRYLISHTRLSVNDIDTNNSTPLHWAVQSGHLKVAAWLVLECKAPIDCVAKNGITPLHLAATRNHLDLVKWLVRHAYKQVSKPRRLINAKDKNGATPLYHSAQAGHLEIVQWLAEKAGGDPTIRSNQGLAPLHAATIGGHLLTVQYLFQFGSASAPGGLRTSEGACALHFAAAEGFPEILQWLLEQKECTGNERDYYQSTPMHDAAERGYLKNVQILCNHGADLSLTDVEGNMPLDLADKNGQNKCVKYLNNLRKQKTGKSSVKSAGRYGNLSRSKTTRAEMIDNFRNAPPHQIPVNVFELDDEEEEIDGTDTESPWATLRDLMGSEAVEQDDLSGSGGSARLVQFSEAEQKRRKLEEDMRREAEERRRKREELLKQETDIEQEIRERLLLEETDNTQKLSLHQKKPESGQLVRRSEPTGTAGRMGREKRLSLPPILSTDAKLSQRGLVEKRTKEFENSSPHLVERKSTLFSKFRRSKKGNMTHSVSLPAGLGSSITPDDTFVDDDDLPEPPPVPTVEYLLGKRPVNLRKRASDSLKQEIQQRAEELEEGEDSDGHSSVSSSHSGSVSSSHSSHKLHRKRDKKKHKRRGSKESDEEDMRQWSYNKLSVPQSSPPRERKVLLGMERHPTPIPKTVTPTDRIPSPIKLDFESAFDEVDQLLALSDISDSPTSLSPVHSPSPNSLASPSHTTAHKPTSTTQTPPTQSKRPTPKLSPHLQNKQVVNSNNNNNNSSERVRKNSPLTKIVSSRAKNRKSTLSEHQAEQILEAAKSPNSFMAALNEAISSSPKLPRFMRQEAVVTDSHTPPESNSPTIDEIEEELSQMQKTLAQSSTRPPIHSSPESESETSSEYSSSSSEDSFSSEEDSSSSSEDEGRSRPKRPIMARNIGLSAAGRRGNGVFNRARVLARYPRLLRRNIIKLEPIIEVPEELVFAAVTVEERAVIYHRLKVEKKHIKAWRKYMQIMRSAYRKAERIIQRKRRELLARTFYSWIQVRNIGAVEKIGTDRALFHYQRRLLRKAFTAWLFDRQGAMMPIARSSSTQWLNAEERYLHWINRQLLVATGSEISDLDKSLADGVLIIKAIAHASSWKPPKYLGRPKVRLHYQDNWKTAHSFMQRVGINMYGIEPADLANLVPAAIHNMFNVILKWEESRC